MTGDDAGERAYAAAGVDLDAAAEAMATIQGLASGARTPEVAAGVGGFAGLYDLGAGRLLAASTDGVGTKLEIARRTGRLDTIGIDLVAMCANDVVCTGARPLFFLDYVALEKVVRDDVVAIVAGVAEGCRRARCALLGGETAEHPGTMRAGELDLAGFCVGAVDADSVLGRDRAQVGDSLVGFPSTGLHANGFSLVRRLLVDAEGAPALDAPDERLGRSLADELLEPTSIYVEPALALAGAGLVHSLAHITGGGFVENLPRALPEGTGAVVEPSTWVRPPIFDVVADAAGLAPEQLFGVLNMGIGMVAVVAPEDEHRAVALARDAGVDARVIGRVVTEPGVMLA